MKHRGMIITVAVALLVTIIGIGAVNGISATSIPSEAVPSVTPTQGMSLLGSLDLCPGSPYFESSAATIDPVRGFAYFMGHNCPDYTTPYQGDGSVIKVNLSNFTVAGGASIFGNTPYSGAIDPTTGYSYVTRVCSCGPFAHRINPANLTEYNSISTNLGDGGGVIDPVHGYYYVGDDLGAGIERIRLSNFTNAGYISSNGYALPTAVIDVAGGFAYFGGPSCCWGTNHIVKVSLSNFTIVGDLALPVNGNLGLASAVIDPSGSFAYFGDGGSEVSGGSTGSPGHLFKVRLSDMSLAGELFFGYGSYLHVGLIDSTGSFAYFCCYTNATYSQFLEQIRLSDFTVVGSLPMPQSGFSTADTGVIDSQNGFAYFAFTACADIRCSSYISQLLKVAIGPPPPPTIDTTSTIVKCNPDTVVEGASTTCTATVTDTSANPTTPTGTVTFTSDNGYEGNSLFTGSVCTLAGCTPVSCALSGSGASASCNVNYNSTGVGLYSSSDRCCGPNTVGVNYSGDATHEATLGSATIVIFAPAPLHPTTTDVSCDAAIVVDQPSNCTATVTDTSGSPTTPVGTVSFSETGLSAGSFSSNPCTLIQGTTGTASCTASFVSTATGVALVNATYTSTDSTHSGSSTTTPYVIIVVQRSVSVAVSCTTPIVVNNPSTCTVTVADTSPGTPITPTGSFALSSNSTGSFSGSCSLSETVLGTAGCAVTYTPSVTGTHTITASYVGDSSHEATQGATTITVNLRSTTTTVTCSVTSAALGQPFTCTATVTDTDTGTPSTPTGIVNWPGTTAGSCTLSGTGTSASCTVNLECDFPGCIPQTTTNNVAANYAGDTTHAGSSGTATVTFTPRTTNTTVACTPPSLTVGSSTSCTVTVTDTTSAGTPVTPTGIFALATNSTGTFDTSCVLSGTGASATCTVHYAPAQVADHEITANYPGDSSHSTSTGSFDLTVTSVPFDYSLSNNGPVTIQAGSSGTVTITVTLTAGTAQSVGFSCVAPLPSGISCPSFVPGSLTPTGSTDLTISVASSVAPGSYSVMVTASPLGAITSPTTVSVTVTVPAKDDTTTSFNCVTVFTIPASGDCIVTVADVTVPSNTPSGTVSFISSDTTVGTVDASCTLDSSGSCDVILTGVGAGGFTVTGTYGGDSTHNGSSGTSGTITVTLDNTSTSVQKVSCNITLGASSCTASVVAVVADTTTPSNTPTGTITFTFTPGTTGGSLSATSCTLSSGSCSVMFTGTTAGSGSISASYGGDSAHNLSTSPTVTVTVTTSPTDITSTLVTGGTCNIPLGGSSCTLTIEAIVSDLTASTNTPSGSVTFTLNPGTTGGSLSANSCTLSTGSTGTTCSVTFTGTTAGSGTVTASNSGDSTHSGSTSGAGTVTVTVTALDNTSTSVSCPSSLTAGTTVSCSVSVTDTTTAPNVPSGSVRFTSSDTTVGTVAASCALDSIGSCSVMITGVAAGTFTTTGTYGGDSTHDGSSGTSAAITVVALVPPLTVDFSFSPSSPAVGQSVSFTSSVSGGTAPYTYAWDFGDGSTSAAASPSHTYSAAGSFTVKLTVTDSSSPPMSQSASHDVSVSPVTGQPDFTISANPTSLTMSGESPLCEGSSTLCDDEAGTTITLTSVNGFDGTVRLARSVLTLGGKVTLYCRPSAIQLTPGATVQIRCFAEAEINPDSPVTLTVTITGRFGPTGQPGSLSHSVDITVTVTHAPTPSADSQSNSLLTALSLVTASTVPGDGPRTHRSSSNSF